MKTKEYALVGFTLFLLIIFMVGCGNNEQASQTATDEKEVIKLKVADLFPTSHPVSADGIVVWMKEVEEMTDGKVQFDYFPSEQLGKAKDLLKVVQNKVADIAFVGPSYVSANMPLSDVMNLPNAFPSSVVGEKVYWELCQGTLREPEFLSNGVVPVFVYTLPPYEIWTTQKPIKGPEDIKGVKLRSVGGIMDKTVSLLGGSPVSIPITEMYEALQRKVVDGTILSPISIKPYKVNELLKYKVEGVSLGTFVGVYVVNESVWNSLPDDVKKAMLEAGKETSEHLANVLDQNAETDMQEFKESGLDVYELTSDEKEKWLNLMQPAEEDWVTIIKSSGGDINLANKILQERKSLLEEFNSK